MSVDIKAQLGTAILYFVPFLFSLCFHEYAHGWMAKRRGDNTAEMMGRLTLNPMAHADIIGTVVLPFMALLFKFPFFGWAKPVPVNERNFKNPRVDMFWVALAGPLSNFILAAIASFLYVFLSLKMPLRFVGLVELLKIAIVVNLFLGVFNMIPLHPLDGGKVLARFLPYKANQFLEDNQQMTSMLLLVLMITGALQVIAGPVYWMADGLFRLAYGVLQFMA